MKLDPTLKADWKMEEPGWRLSSKPKLGVNKERGGKWHSYITAQENPDNTPRFRTMREAMIDAENRYVDSGEKGTK